MYKLSTKIVYYNGTYMIIEFFLEGLIVHIRSVVPDSLILMFRVSDFVPRFESNPVLCSYGLSFQTLQH